MPNLVQMDLEMKRSDIVQTQARREREAMEKLMKEKQDEFFDKMEAIHIQLQAAEADANTKMQQIEEVCSKDVDKYKVFIFVHLCYLSP